MNCNAVKVKSRRVKSIICEAVRRRPLDPGKLIDKAGYMEIHLSAEREFTVFDTFDTIFRVSADTAFLMWQIVIVNAKMPERKDSPERYITVYVRKESDWKCLARQETVIRADEKF